MEVFGALQKLAETPVPTLLIIAGLFFLFLAIGGQVGAKLLTAGVRTTSAGVIGAILLFIGVGLHLSAGGQPEPPRDPQEGGWPRAEPPPPEPPWRRGEEREIEMARAGEPPHPERPAEFPEGMEFNIDRPGRDFHSFDLPHPDPHLCQEACHREEHCRAWTYVKPGFLGEHARCWLKNPIPPTERNPCCISGVKG